MCLRHINDLALCNNTLDKPTFTQSVTATEENTELPVNLPTGSSKIYLFIILVAGTVLLVTVLSVTFLMHRLVHFMYFTLLLFVTIILIITELTKGIL